ncbi:spore germination protein [Cohnella sp.]|uniref:spore germination protein n=1 Tax=Cohnella sp. TaxID=1883426 RepID=UPI003562ABB1
MDLPLADEENGQLTSDIEQNEMILKRIFQNCSDMVYRKIQHSGQIQWLIVYIESLVDEKHLDEYVLKPLISNNLSHDGFVPANIEIIDDRLVSVGLLDKSSKVADIVRNMLGGQVAIMSAGDALALTVAVSDRAQRNPEEPPSELVVRGPRDGFIENITTNIGLLRSRLKTSRLKTESLTIGQFSQTRVVISYLNGIVTDSLVDEVRKRLSRIQVDGVLESGYIEGFIEDYPYSPFPQVNSSERPDVIAAGLLEGKVAILVDTTPFVLLVPMTFWSALHASEDYYNRSLIATFVRWIRFLFIFISIFAPSLYVAVTTYHQEMIPTNLMLSIAAAREAVPFPALIEALLMEVMFEALREAGVRMPRQVGQAVSIVGALVIGQAAVEAGIISAPVVIIVATTGIASFTIPRFNFSYGIQFLRFPMILLAGTLGLYGIVLGFLGILLHVTSLRSFGVPYFSPIAPLSFQGLKDVLISQPIWNRNLRPESTGSNNPVRIPKGQKPGPGQGK